MCYRFVGMVLRLRRQLLVGLGAAVAGALLSCATPTLPLPPPVAPEMSTQGLPPGEVRLSSTRGAEPNAIIVTYNRNPAVPNDQRVGGAQADGVGTWDAVITASKGDVIDITQEFGSTRSPSTTIVIR